MRRPCVRRSAPAAVFIALLLLPAPAVVAQQYDEEIAVRVIQIPVNVSRGGKAVEGLDRDDFEVFVNGEAQPVAYFDVLEFSETSSVDPPPPQPPADLAQRRLTLLLFDVSSSTFNNLRRAREQVDALVRRSSNGDLFAAAVFSGRSGVRYLVPFTHDRPAVLHAVSTLAPSRSGDALALTITPQERQQSNMTIRGVPTRTTADQQHAADLEEGVAEFEETIEAWRESRGGLGLPSMLNNIEADRHWEADTAAGDWTEALGRMAGELAPLEGIKHVVLFSEAHALDAASSMLYGPALERMLQQFRRAGVVLHVVDIAGLRVPGSVDARATHAPDFLFTAALGTGGRVIHGAGIETAVRMLAESRSVTYLLGIRPPAKEEESNEIRVRVKGQPPFTEVSHRRGYARSGKDARSVSGLVLADVMLNDIRRNDLTVDMRVRRAKGPLVDVVVPGDELLAHASLGSIEADIFIYVFDQAGNVAGSKHRRVSLNAARVRTALAGKSLTVTEPFELPPGRYAAKSLVRIVGRDRMGFQRLDFSLLD
jgi:VWFA-related protein